ncbi:VOC family protein [Xanthomonas sacchari]|uniref:VOC family protein n=1 Tax=Xanthomonas sacchari TaxID=56458 RepID=UPI00225DE48F|nr:VOC family protein [Xanthomonas sacchari]
MRSVADGTRTGAAAPVRYASPMDCPVSLAPTQRMTFTTLTPMLRCADLTTALAFYTETLAFRLDGGAVATGWVSLRHGPLALMLATRLSEDDATVSDVACSLYFRTDEVDAWWQRLHPHGRIVYPLQDFDYGMREFAIHDADGHLLQFGQTLCR